MSTTLPAASSRCSLDQRIFVSVSSSFHSCSWTLISQAKVRRPLQLSCPLLPEHAYRYIFSSAHLYAS